ncbi:MAG: TetR family transcriptional regulator [Xanthomonadales bacterium]|nr:TetR family transcriptional regulator [Xanthomonadales bacterium]NIN60218.1 TetR family transcriptional regulator [Xanthomonadales bacterium]NIN74380.1 TetR family transcriptional regulator [Xanthomonadales bacterium]NIO13185.1 TetR family transcriptional regulator [Xanthomonadales bacterium]NIP12611.1 TetR family transcriptional regulator [Xanthomonadales bacterium]
MKRRPRDAEATRKDILDRAEKLFIQQGFGSTSLAQIGAACRCANSLIVHHFRNKQGLWNAVKDRAFEEFVEESKQVFGDEPVSAEELDRISRGYYRLLERNPGLVQLLVRAELEQDALRNQFNPAQLDPFVDRLRKGQRAGLLRDDIPPEHLLLILINTITRWFQVRHMLDDWLGEGGVNSGEAFLGSAMKVVLEGALARPAEAAA